MSIKLFLLSLSFFITNLLIAQSLLRTEMLRKGKTIEKQLAAGQKDIYSLNLNKGEFAKVVAVQKGIDIVVTVLDPNNKKITEVDSPNGTSGPEPASFAADISGNYSIEIKSLEPTAKAGDYTIEIQRVISAEEYKLRNAKNDSKLNEEYSGNYQLAPGRIISLGSFDEFGSGTLGYLDLKTNRAGVLYPLSDGSFYATPKLGDDYTMETRIRFIRDKKGQINSILWHEKGTKSFTGKKVFQHTSEDISFQNNGVVLRGLLMVPKGKGPHPAVVFAHGSGDATRNVGFFNTFFLSRGLAVLSYDKRGSGKSTGDWKTSSFNDLATDLKEGINFLKKRNDIDPKQIGIHGSSQGGWIGALATAGNKDVAFFISRVGSGVTVKENVIHENEGRMREKGTFSEAEIKEAQIFNITTSDMASRGAPLDSIYTEYLKIKEKPWSSYTFPVGSPKDSPWWTWYKLNGDTDPVESLKKITQPVLWFLGRLDRNVPSEKSAPIIKNALLDAKNKDFKVVMLENTGHGFMYGKTGFMNTDFQESKYYVPGYWDTMAKWLSERIRLPK